MATISFISNGDHSIVIFILQMRHHSSYNYSYLLKSWWLFCSRRRKYQLPIFHLMFFCITKRRALFSKKYPPNTSFYLVWIFRCEYISQSVFTIAEEKTECSLTVNKVRDENTSITKQVTLFSSTSTGVHKSETQKSTQFRKLKQCLCLYKVQVILFGPIGASPASDWSLDSSVVLDRSAMIVWWWCAHPFECVVKRRVFQSNVKSFLL